MSANTHLSRSRPPFLWGALVLCLAASHCLALDPERTIFQYNCRTWTRQNGLPADGVNAIAQTADGYLWLGTAEGLVSFDGIEFKSRGLSHLQSQIVTSLSSSRDGGLWIGMEHGAFAYCDGQNITNQGREAWGGVNLDLHAILETRDHALWLGAETQPARLSKEHLFQTIGDYDTTALMQDSKGRVWIGTAHRGLFWWENGVLTRFPDHAFDDQEIRALAEDKDGQIWIGTDWGPLCYDSNFLRKDFPFPWHPICALLVDREGTLWMGTTGAGLFKYQNGTTTSFRRQDGLADDNVSALAEDQEGNLWIGTRDGLSEFTDFKIPTFTKTEGVPAGIIADVSASRNGGLWLATGHGFTYFDGKGNSSTTILGLTNEYVNRVFEAKNGDIYLINGYKDIEIFRGTNVLARYTNEDWPSAFGEDDNGVVVGIRTNLFRVGTNYFSPFSFAGGQSPELGWIFNIAPGRDGSLWLATTAGICRIKDGVFKLWSVQDGLPDGRTVWVGEDNEGVVWAGLDKGIARIKDGKVTTVNRDHGLFDNIIYSAIPDNHGRLWVDSSRGFFSLDTRSFDDFVNGKTDRVTCTDFTGLDGVKSSDRFRQKETGCRTLDGRIWFPTAQGVVMIDPDRVKTQAIAPRIYIQSTRADGTELKPGEKTARPGKGDLEFQYAGLSYIAPQRIHYRYMLQGYNKEWVDAGTRRSAFYTNLKPGQYRFLVQACNEDGVWSTASAFVNVELLPHFYQTTWFISLAVAAFIAALLAIYVWRLKLLTDKQRQLHKTRDLLEVKVRERTSELRDEIEERKRAEAALGAERTLLRTVIDLLPDYIYAKDTQHRFLLSNETCARLMGAAAPAELIGKTDADYYSSALEANFYADELAVLKGVPLINKEEPATRPDGIQEFILTTKLPLKDGSGKIIGLVGCGRIITERKRAEAALATEQRLLSSLITATPDVIYFKDRESRFIRINEAFARRQGLSDPSAALGKTDFDLFGEQHAREAYADEQRIIATGQPIIDKEEREDWKDGHITWASSTKMPLLDGTGKIIGIMGISRDITERKRLETQLIQSQKMETVGKLAGGIAHEFNSILTAIIGQSELLLGDLPAGSPLAKNATEITQAADRAATLTRQLLAYGRKQFLRPETLNLNQIITSMDGVLSHLMGGEMVDVNIVPATGLKVVKADTGQVEQVIMNLAMNARDAMPHGGKLTLETANVSFDQDSVGRNPELKPGAYVMLAITDTGRGMSEKVKAHAFEPFFTTKDVGQGTGLGLSTCYGIIKQSGGHINVYSEPGRGTTFKIYLPQVEPPTKIPIEHLDSPELPRGTETILLVEDDPALREMAATLLRRLGYTVLAANHGVEAMSLCHQPDTGRIDLLFTDVVMPHMNGKELADRVRALYPHTRILFTSAYTENAILHQGVSDKGMALLQKPFAPSALARKVRELLDAPDAAPKTSGITTNSDEAKTLGS